MATVKLHVSETTEEDLPNVCMVCGQPGVTHIRKNFSWYPPWVAILILPGVLIFAIVASILTKRMTVAVPVCENHRSYWLKRNLLIWLPILLLAALGIGVLVALSGNRRTQDAAGWACAGIGVIFLVWVIIAAVISWNGVRPNEITDRGISLTNIHPDFVDALDDMARNERRRDRPRRLRRDDDYDDDRPRRLSRADDYDDDRPPRRDDRGPGRPPPLPPDAFRDTPPRRADDEDQGHYRQ